MSELGNRFSVYEYLCDKLGSGGLKIEEVAEIGNLSIGQQSVSGMIAMNQRLGYIIERGGRLFTAGESSVRLTSREQKVLEEKAQAAGLGAEEFLGQLVASMLSE